MKNIILSAAIVSFLAACSSTPIKPVEQAVATPTASAAKPTPVAPLAATQISPLKDPNNILSQRSVYFDYDKYLVNEKYRALIQAHAAYLRTHPEASIMLEGNTDERGSSEYNLALGQKRAEVVRKMMALIGVADKQMESISFGKEKPKASGSNEAAWAQNRRTDVRYKGE